MTASSDDAADAIMAACDANGGPVTRLRADFLVADKLGVPWTMASTLIHTCIRDGRVVQAVLNDVRFIWPRLADPAVIGARLVTEAMK